MQADQNITGRPEFEAIYTPASLMQAAIDWLQQNDADPQRIVADALRDLVRRGRALPRAQRVRYADKALLGEFFARWVAKHAGRSIRSFESDEEKQTELRPFQLALMAVGDERAFKKITPQLARKRMVEQAGISLGTADEFSAFVAEHTDLLADRFLENFDSTRPSAARNAVRYLQVTAVSYYLRRWTRPIRMDAPNLDEYVKQSTRLSPRTALAVKLAYIPALLTHQEREALRNEYGFEGSFARRMPIKDIAKTLGFKSPAVLSRKLYRARAWCRSARRRVK